MAAKLIVITLVIWLCEAIVLLSISDKPWRFSLGSLLTAMTITAFVMGLIAAMAGSRAE
jgi:hypothetical protein